MKIAIITNLKLPNQRETAAWLRQGFGRHGLKAQITGDRNAAADLYVVQGPWYALRQFTGRDRVLYLDRTHYGHPRFDISLGWLLPDGSRDFCNLDKTEPKGTLPELEPRKTYLGQCVVFGDYGHDMGPTLEAARKAHPHVYFRPHPADRTAATQAKVLRGDLDTIFRFADYAIGHASSVLVQALIYGLTVESTDPRHVIHSCGESRSEWLTRLSWANWNWRELVDGSFWSHLKCR